MASIRELTESKELAILNRISTALSRSLDLDTVLDVALHETMSALRINNGGIYIFDPVERKLILKVRHNMSEAFIRARSVVGPGEGCTGTAYDTKEIFSGYGTPEKVYICADAEELMGIDCLAASPIIFKNEVLGVLELFAPVDRKLTKKEINLLSAICNQIGVTVANANSHQALKSALKNSRLLLESAEAIVSTLNLDEILERLFSLVSELTHISRAAIWLYSKQRNSLVLARDFETISAGFVIELKESNGPLSRAIRDKTSLTVEDFSDAATRFAAIADRFAVKSLLIVPMIYKGEAVGLMMLDKPGIKHEFSEHEVDLAEGIASQAVIAIKNAQAFKEQRTIAETLQKSFLPLENPVAPGIEIGVRYEPATLGALVGGDFYDFINLENNLGFVIGDVSGKGVEAATLTGIVKNTVRTLAIEGLSPTEVVTKTNKLISRQIERSQFVTLFFGMIDLTSGKLSYTNAGHPPALLYQNSKKKISSLGCHNSPVGIFEDYVFEELSTAMVPGDTMLLYTDGVTEARREEDFFGEARLQKLFLKFAGKDADFIADRIIKATNEFNRGEPTDDIAIMVLKKL